MMISFHYQSQKLIDNTIKQYTFISTHLLASNIKIINTLIPCHHRTKLIFHSSKHEVVTKRPLNNKYLQGVCIDHSL